MPPDIPFHVVLAPKSVEHRPLHCGVGWQIKGLVICWQEEEGMDSEYFGLLCKLSMVMAQLHL